MDILQILLISVGLAADAFAVSVVKGLSVKNISLKDTIKLSLCFGTFQGIMPLIGYLLGSAFEKIIVNVDHYVAFVLLGFIGIKMIIESNNEEENNNSDLTNSRNYIGSLPGLLRIRSFVSSVEELNRSDFYYFSGYYIPSCYLLKQIKLEKNKWEETQNLPLKVELQNNLVIGTLSSFDIYSFLSNIINK